MLFPVLQLHSNAIYEVLFLARLEEISLALVVHASEDVFQSIDCVLLDAVPQSLKKSK